MVDDQLDVPLEDAELLAEVELTANLMIAASEADEPLGQDRIDALLGLTRDGTSAQQPIPTQTIRNT